MNKLSKNESPLRTMKRLAVCAMLVLICVSANARNKAFDELEKIQDVECVHLNKMLLKMAAMSGEGVHVGESINIGGNVNGIDVLKQIDDLKVYTTESEKAIEEMKTIVLKILKDKEWEPLVEANEDGEAVKIYQARKGKKITNIIFALEDNEATLVILSGTFDIGKLIQQQAEAEN